MSNIIINAYTAQPAVPTYSFDFSSTLGWIEAEP